MGYYETLLDIPEDQGPPDYFQLLGISREDTDPELIKAAATRQINKLRQYLNGPHDSAAKKLAGEVKRAYQVLSQQEQRAKYLVGLDQQHQRASVGMPSSNQPAAAVTDSLSANTGKRSFVLAGSAALVLLVGIGTIAYLTLRTPPTPVVSVEPTPAPIDQTLGESSSSEPLSGQPIDSSVTPEPINESPEIAVDQTPPGLGAVQTPLALTERGQSGVSNEQPMQNAVTASAQTIAHEETQGATEAVGTNEPAEDRGTQDRGTQGDVDHANLAGAAQSVLSRNCFRCHGENEADEGGFNFALSRAKLISAGFVVPNNIKESVLVQRMVSSDSPMPPEGESPRPDDKDIQIVSDWIRSGAKPFDASAPQPMISTGQMYELIAADLNRVSKQDRMYVRYFSVTHLRNSGYSAEEIQLYKLALAKLLNSLSWNRQLASLQVAEGLSTVYRVDLRDLKWTDQNWETILKSYPYGLLHDTFEAMQVRDETNSDVPVIRADWFVSVASRPPLYHQLAQIPETDKQLEQLLQVNVARNLEEHRVVRAGFARSGVSQHNRLIERHESIFGAYWKSYDFAGSTGRKNLFDYPIGPGETASDFDHDGGEIIFQLPNGMLAYMLTDATGRRIDRGPTNIVSDPRQGDRAVVNGISCMSCHYGGFIQKKDEIRSHVMANRSAFMQSDEILNLYRDPKEATGLIASDTKAYLQALGSPEIGIEQPTRAGEPIVLAALRYNNELDVTLAAAELGVDPDKLREQLSKLGDPVLSRRVGALKTTGGVVKRETFVDAFSKLANVMNLGKFATAKPPPAAPAAAGGPVPAPPVVKPVVIASLPFGRDRAAAERSLSTAERIMNSADWREAGKHFEAAIKLATDAAFRLRACEQAIEFYERSEAVEPLLSAHKYVLDSCQSAFEISRAHDHLFQSLRKVVRGPTWRGSTEIKWPISVTRAVSATFTPELAKNPNHEPTLRVLQTFYRDIQDDPKKRKVVLERLAKILGARGQFLEHAAGIDLAELLIESGEAKRGAMIMAHYAQFVTGTQAATLLYWAANAWIQAGDKDKAMVALKKSQKLWQASRDSIAGGQIALIGDAFMELDERTRAVDAYKLAIRLEKSPRNLQRLQEKLAAATVDPAAQKPGAADAETMDDLLDPNRKFRLDAERYENSASSSASSIFSNMTYAAENWLKAGEKERATAALNKASVANRRVDPSRYESNHARLAELYRKAEQNQHAIDQWTLALKTATRATSINKYQTQIELVMQEDSSLKVDPQHAALMDAKYDLRVQAKQAEDAQAYDPSHRVRNLTHAASYWQQAGETEDARRCLSAAETSIKKVKSQSPYPPEAEMHRKLADLYKSLELPKDEVRNLLAAMKFAHNDNDVVRDHQRITKVCEEHSLPKPELDPSVAARLDPLNRYRVEAAKYEQRAKTSSSTASTHLRLAITNWIKAEETEEAIRVANQWAKLVMKDDTNSQFERDCTTLGEIFTELGQKPAAVKCYQEALRVSKYDHRKRRIQEKLDELKVSDE